jgi:hypothetical protein
MFISLKVLIQELIRGLRVLFYKQLSSLACQQLMNSVIGEAKTTNGIQILVDIIIHS